MSTVTTVKEMSISALKVVQPIGEFFIAVMSSSELARVAEADIRRMEKERDNEREVEKYLGVQRPLREDRIKEIKEYVRGSDAAFPSSVILAIEGRCAEWDEHRQVLKLREYVKTSSDDPDEISIDKIASILDGQHRVKGLVGYDGPQFDVPVSIFIDADIATQATIFSTVNLAQTKVNKSLVYDLFDLAKTRSPQKTCHNVAVILNSEKESPLNGRIKRLGVATEGKFQETITQATFVESLLRYVSGTPGRDRETLLRGKRLPEPNIADTSKFIFRHLFIAEKDAAIGNLIWNYFDAVKERWPDAWSNFSRGNILIKTNGFRAFFRFIRPLYRNLHLQREMVWTKDQCREVLDRVTLGDSDFTTSVFLPGTSGESELFKRLCADTGFTDSR